MKTVSTSIAMFEMSFAGPKSTYASIDELLTVMFLCMLLGNIRTALNLRHVQRNENYEILTINNNTLLNANFFLDQNK